MAKDMLEAIYQTEEECKQNEAQAKAKAEQIKCTAEDNAKKLIADKRLEAQKNTEQRLEAVRAEGERLVEQSKKTADKQCNDISSLAEKNRKRVIEKTAKLLID